jgi:hypothetical protein
VASASANAAAMSSGDRTCMTHLLSWRVYPEN